MCYIKSKEGRGLPCGTDDLEIVALCPSERSLNEQRVEIAAVPNDIDETQVPLERPSSPLADLDHVRVASDLNGPLNSIKPSGGDDELSALLTPDDLPVETGEDV